MVKTQTSGFGFSVRASMAQLGLNAIAAVAFYPSERGEHGTKHRLKFP